MTRVLCCAIATAFTVASAQPLLADEKETPITITGCVAKGEKSGYLLKNVSLVNGTAPAGVSADQIYLRLNTTNGLKAHVGHQVNVMGKADFSDMDKGKLEVTRESDGLVTVSLSSERRKVTSTANPSDPTVRNAPTGTSGTASVPTYKMKVDSVTMVSGSCSM